ncbi:MAG: aminoglycoside phosphotransferase family protein, partial [Rhodospirillales bacterium]
AGQGVDVVPRPMACDPSLHCAAYEWIEGTPVANAGRTDIEELADFFLRLQSLRGREGALSLPLASAACLSAAQALGQAKARLQRLTDAGPHDEALALFLKNELIPGFKRIEQEALAGLRTAGIDPSAELAKERQVLSPSDFGRHNLLRCADGRLAFVDFEYFGWDDPVKAVADVLLHPGSAFNKSQGGIFKDRVAFVLSQGDAQFEDRFRCLFPVYAVIWCLILLNEFLPERLARRQMAGQAEDARTAQRRQLQKAQAMLKRSRDEQD